LASRLIFVSRPINQGADGARKYGRKEAFALAQFSTLSYSDLEPLKLEGKMLKPLVVAAVLALTGSAEAHDYSADMVCRVTETDGNRSAWSFAPNTIGADGSPVSTFVETSYLGHGKSVVSQAGSRPVWLMAANPLGGVTLLPRNNPGWALVVSNLARAGTSIAGGYATLLHNGALIGVGQCAQRTVPTAATVGDVAPE
jgi:hypothetical protein